MKRLSITFLVLLTCAGAYAGDGVCHYMQSESNGLALHQDSSSGTDLTFTMMVADISSPPEIYFHNIPGTIAKRNHLYSRITNQLFVCIRNRLYEGAVVRGKRDHLAVTTWAPDIPVALRRLLI